MLTIPLLKMKRDSTEYVRLPYTANVDPESVGDIDISFVEGHGSVLPDSPDWHTAEKLASHVRLLVGPGTPVELGRGVYNVYARVAASPETVIERVGMIYVA